MYSYYKVQFVSMVRSYEVKEYCLVEEKVTTTLFASTYPTPAECTQQLALPNSTHTHTHTHTQAHTHATHAHTCTPIAPGLPMAACGRETSWLANNSLSLWLPQHPYAKMFLCEQGAHVHWHHPTGIPSDIHFNTQKKPNQNKTQKSFLTENKHM